MNTLIKPLLAALIAATALSACGQKPTEAAGMPTPQVSVAAPLKQNITDWDEFVGRFEASQHVDVRARAGGFIQGVHFKDGQVVKKGQLLFTLDPRSAQASLASAEADAAVARKAFERAEVLMKDQAISRQDFDQRRATLDVADAVLRARKLDVEFTRVTAPVSGTVSDRRVDAGNVIAGGTSAADILTTIVATDDVYFNFEASEAQLLKYQREAEKSGGKVEIRLQDENAYRWTGSVDFSDNAINSGSGAVRMRALVKNQDGFLKPGMFGHARVEGSSEYTALMIPETAVVADGARKIAYVVGADGTVGVKPLETGPIVDGLRVVRSGLSESDQVIVNGIQRVMPGAAVQAKLTTITQTAELVDASATKVE
ncbi:MAG: efflux RND transporter periplasmic adaptor subunit [Hyphomonadaceae bacterium]|nr:efflux RND transporter periplasmic adaptor subunit [Hyphomonadaceae bacterium]